MFFVLLAIACSLCVFYHYWTKRRLYFHSAKLPGPLHLPFFGCTYKFFLEDASGIAKRFSGFFDDYPGLCKVWMGQELYYLVSKPEYLEILLNSPATLEKNDIYKYTKPAIGNGLISGPAKTWKRHRKIIGPSLNQKILNEYPEMISAQCNLLVEILQKFSGKGEIDHCRYVTNCALDIIGETICGLSISAQSLDEDYSHVFDRLMEIIFLRVFRLTYHSDLIFYFTKHNRDLQEVIVRIKTLTLQLIERKKEQLSCRPEIDDEKKLPLLDLLVQKFLNGVLGQDELEDEVNTFILAGTDTNATTNSFILTLLGMHPDIQEKVHDEAIEVLGPDRLITLDDLPKLKYTERVVKESLRIFPGAPFVGRTVEEDIVLDDVVVPKGANVGFGFLHLHRSDKYWEEPFKFDPDRFLPEKAAGRHPYSWLPFSGGPRGCIGIKYGMMVMKIMTATVIRKFKVRSSIKAIEDIALTTNIVLKPRDGFRLAFELR